MLAYPVSFPTAEVVDIYSHIKAGTVYEHKAEVAKDVWIVQGYAQRTAFGEPGEVAAAGVLELTAEDRVHIQALATELEALKSDEATVEIAAKDRPFLRFLLENGLPLLLKLLA